jgi:hypothetical protein
MNIEIRPLRRLPAALFLSTVVAVAAVTPGALAAAPLPGASTGGVSNLGSSTVLLNGSVNPRGQATSYVFQYGTTVGYGAQTPLASAGAGKVAIKVAQGLAGLQPNTIYHYRILATSTAGTAPGADRTFKTHKLPLALQISGVPNPVVFGSAFTVQGTLSGTGGAGRAVALQYNPFPYTAGFASLGNPEVTSSTGGFSFPVVGLLVNAQLRVVTTTAPVIVSPVVLEGVAVRVSFHVRRVHRRRPGRFYRMYGTVTPAVAGARVGFQLLRRGAPSLNKGGAFVRTAPGAGSSHYSAVVRVRHRGTYKALVQVGDGSHASAYSPAVRVR